MPYRRHLMNAVGAHLIMMAASIVLTSLSFFPAAITHELRFEQAPFFRYYTILALVSVVSMIAAGQLVQRIGIRWLVFIGGSIAGGGLALFACSSSLPMFYLSGFVIGVGYGCAAQYTPVLIVNTWFVAKKGLVMGVVLAGSGVGGVIWSLVLPGLISLHGWRSGAWFVAAAMLLLTWVSAWFLISDSPAKHGLSPFGVDLAGAGKVRGEGAPGFTFTQALRSPWLYLCYIVFATLGVIHAMSQIAPAFFSSLGMGPERVSVLILAWQLGLIAGKPLVGLLCDRWGRLPTFALGLGLQSVAAVLLPAVSLSSALSYLLLLMVGIAAGMSTGTMLPPLIASAALGQRAYPQLWAVLGTAYTVGVSIGAPLWGLVFDYSGNYALAFYAVPVIAVFIVGLSAVAIRQGRRAYQKLG